MKFLTLIFLALALFTFTKAQNLENLDSKMGFNKFKLESSFDLYKKDLKFDVVNSDDVKFYYYTGKDISSVLGLPFYKINLAFYKKRLYSISITFLYTSPDDNSILQTKLQQLFGHTKILSKVKKEGGSSLDWVMQWTSQKVLLQLQQYDITDSNTQEWTTEIFLYSKGIHSEILNSSF